MVNEKPSQNRLAKPAQHRVYRTSAGIRPHFWDSAPNGGFGVWWFFPLSPALAGNACRWAFQGG